MFVIAFKNKISFSFTNININYIDKMYLNKNLDNKKKGIYQL